jgi:hypothetical protein
LNHSFLFWLGDLKNYGIEGADFQEAMRDFVYIFNLRDVDLSIFLQEFEFYGTKFLNYNTKHIIRVYKNDKALFRHNRIRE